MEIKHISCSFKDKYDHMCSSHLPTPLILYSFSALPAVFSNEKGKKKKKAQEAECIGKGKHNDGHTCGTSSRNCGERGALHLLFYEALGLAMPA